MSKRSKTDILTENRILRARLRSNTIARALEALAKWGGISFVAYCALEAIRALAGKSTWADIGLTLKGLEIDCKWALIAGAVLLGIGVICSIIGFVYGQWQAKLRKDVIKEKSDRIVHLEKMIDTRRSTSGLTPTGDSQPEGK